MTLVVEQPIVRRAPRRSAPTRAADAVCVRDPVVGMHTVCLLRLLERVALRFADAGIPLMVLKGAALNLTIHDRPDLRAMSDLDLMVPPEHADRAVRLLVEMGCRSGRPLVRTDFFPRFHYERDFACGRVTRLRIDLHVRPFRPLRYARTVPAEAFWRGAQRVRVGRAEVFVPGVEDMLLHLAVHSAVHGNLRGTWLLDLKQWADAWDACFDWARFVNHAQAWGLMLAADNALSSAEDAFGRIRPAGVRETMAAHRAGWRERRVLEQAPDDARGALKHVLTDAMCTPGWRFRLGYLRAMLLPDRAHLAEWYDHRHPGWCTNARVLRLVAPLVRRVPWLWDRVARVEVRETPRGPGVFARRRFRAGERLFSFAEGGGKLACVRHSCHPNARQTRRNVRAVKFIAPNEEIHLDFGIDACDCRRRSVGADEQTQH